MANYNNNRTNNNRNGGKFQNGGKKTFKPRYTKVNVAIADSNYYNSNLDSLYNLLDSISFDKVAVPVTISKAVLFDNPQLKGTVVFGTINKFNSDNTFTLSVQENFASKIEESSGYVLGIRCKKDFETGDITYVYSFSIIKGETLGNEFDDIEKEMLASEETAE